MPKPKDPGDKVPRSPDGPAEPHLMRPADKPFRSPPPTGKPFHKKDADSGDEQGGPLTPEET